MASTPEDERRIAAEWFAELRDQICASFEQIEEDYDGPLNEQPAGKFERKTWDREGGGGGIMSILRGRVFEKAGVNISTVMGEHTEEFARTQPGMEGGDRRFWASGISLVAHMQSPHVPAAHMNTRHMSTAISWFGGGGDLNPIFPVEQDTEDFHAAFKVACDAHDPAYYPKFKKECDEYFYIHHRNEPRGVGGIFYDRINSGNWDEDMAFTRDVGLAFADIYPQIIRRHMNKSWTAEERDTQLIKRGRYVEFNLVWDRGTKFGLETGGNAEAILMTMPPVAKWP